jgi:hypothetical protein
MDTPDTRMVREIHCSQLRALRSRMTEKSAVVRILS